LKFKERFLEQEEVLCLYRVPDLIEIRYDGKPIQKLSLGQRASSLLLLLLSQENTPVIMDQPEDDLDNQTVYEGLIKKVLKLKGERQIIFATHNPNIPVLGDCEQVIIFKNEDDKILAEAGSIDRFHIQKKIVDIMEGGEEAFTKRKEIYYQWTL
jgi:ABC-type cobalamin/Fe3+-siderophores transport system ATPase subunit